MADSPADKSADWRSITYPSETPRDVLADVAGTETVVDAVRNQRTASGPLAEAVATAVHRLTEGINVDGETTMLSLSRVRRAASIGGEEATGHIRTPLVVAALRAAGRRLSDRETMTDDRGTPVAVPIPVSER